MVFPVIRVSQVNLGTGGIQNIIEGEEELQSSIDPFHIVISLSNRSSIEKSIKSFLKMKGQIAY